MDISELQYLLGMVGTVAFAATAVAAVAPKGIDIFGAMVMAVITAIGGGTIRDLILGTPVFWADDLTYIWVAIFTSLVAFLANRFMTRKQIFKSMLYFDALGVSLFAVQATHKVIDMDFGKPLAPILLGIVTAIGGGLVRDVLAGNTTLLMRRELYAIPVTIGCTAYAILWETFAQNMVLIGGACMLFIFGLRAAAIFWDLQVPNWLATKPAA